MLGSDGILIKLAEEVEAWVRQVPKPVWRMIARSPRWKSFTFEPVDNTSTTPSLPATAEGSGVPRAVVKGGLAGYTPSIWGRTSVRKRREGERGVVLLG